MRKNSVKWEKLKNQRFLLMLFFAAIIITQCTTSFAIPASGEENTCPYHMEHDENCGYVEAAEGHPCSHVCDENCTVLAENCPHVHDEECGYDESLGETSCTHIHTEDCYEMITSCSHEHDETCAYVEAVEGVECGHICEACSTAGNLNLTEVFFDKNPECEEYQDVLVTFENGEDTLTGVMVKGENHSEQSALEYVLDEAGEKLTLTKKTLEMLDCGNYTVSLEMKSGVQLSFSLFVLDSREENEPETYRISTVAIDETNFPDAIFRNYVSTNFDIDHSGDLTAEEIENVTEISLSGTAADRHQVTSLKGIEYFKNLIKLDCGFGNGGLTTLDLSANTKLQELWAVHNRLTELDISTCVNLISISLQQENLLTELDVSHCIKLESLTCENMLLKHLILPKPDENGTVHLEALSAPINCLSDIDFSDYHQIHYSLLDLRNQDLKNLLLIYDKSKDVYIHRGRTFASDIVFYSDADMMVEKSGFRLENGYLTIDAAAGISDTGTVYFRSDDPFGLSGSFRYSLRPQIEARQAKALSDANGLLTYLGVTGTAACEEIEKIKNGVPGKYIVTVTDNGDIYDAEVEVVVAIDEGNFPDVTFRTYVSTNFDQDADDFLNAEEIEAITSVILGGTAADRHQVTSLKGIEYFKNLIKLDCGFGNGKLTTLNLSANTKLQELYAVHNRLTELDISTCVNLISISLQQENLLTELDVSHCTKLESLTCEGTPIENLVLPNADVNGIYSLHLLAACHCSLSYLDLRNYGNLNEVYIYGQNPQPLNMTLQNSSWTDTSGRNFASGTDFAGNPATRFYKTCNSWTEGEMTDEVAFSVNASGAVTADQVLPIVNQVYFQSKIPSPPGKEYVLNGSFSYGVSGNLTENTRNLDFSEAAVTLPENVQDLVGVLGVTLGADVTYTVTCENYEQARQGTIGSYPVTIIYDQLTISSSIEVGVSINSTNFPDTYFENWIKESVAGAADGFLTAAELDAVTEIAISGAEGQQKEYKSLQGIEYFRKLKNLYCTWGKLTELDLSKNTELLIVFAYHNSLKRVDVSGCKKLYHLEIQRNAVTELTLPVNGVLNNLFCEGNLLTKDTFDLTGQTKLKELHCYDMHTLTEINLSQNTELKGFSCTNSALESLDLSANTQLETLYCSRNALTELELTNNTALKNLACSNNQLTSLNVNHLTALENLECAGNHLTSLDVSGLSSDLTVDAEGQTIEKPLSMSYSDGSWKNTAKDNMEPVRSFHTQGTLLYDAKDQTPLDAFSVNAQGTLTATRVFDIVHSVAYESVLYDNTGMVRSGKLKGTFCYVPQYTLSAGDVMISSNAIREKLTGAADLSPLKNMSGLIVSNPDLSEIKTAVTITVGTADFQSMKAGTAGVYTYTLTLGSSSLSGTITVYEVDLEAMIIIPATIQLTRDYIQNQAVAEGEIKLQSGTTAPGTVEVSADTSVTLTGKSDSNQTIAVNVYDGANQYQGNGALASLTTLNNQKTFKLISGDVSSLKAQTYTGTMNFTIRYRESE